MVKYSLFNYNLLPVKLLEQIHGYEAKKSVLGGSNVVALIAF